MPYLESFIFTPVDVTTDADFNAFVNYTYPPHANAADVDAAIEAHYPPIMSSPPSNYTSAFARTEAGLGDSAVECTVRYLTDAYAGKTYNLQYSVTPGYHATDLLPTFYNLDINLATLNTSVSYPLIPFFGTFAQSYQSYLVSHARSGNPNTYAKTLNVPPAIYWPQPDTSGDELTGVLNAGDTGFSLISDATTTETICDFWREVAAAVTDLGGYAPPGSVVDTTLAPVTNNPSAKYSNS